MDKDERFREELLNTMEEHLSKTQMFMLGNVLTKMFTRYHVEETSYEVGFYDNTNENLKKRFIASLRLEGKSEQTLEQYSLAIDMLLADVDKNLTEMKTNDIRYHLGKYQEERNIKKVTIDNRRRNLSSFFSWMVREEYIDKSPMLKIKKIKSEIEVKPPFSDNELEKLRNAASKSRDYRRDRALIEFLLTTGCRVSEVIGIELKNINFLNGECIVHGKGNKERKVYISDKANYYLQEYIMNRKYHSDILFTNRFGNRWSKQSIEKIVKSIAKKAGVDNAHPHRFRRTFATNALNKGMAVQSLQKILGHQSLDTTMRYCTVDDDLIKLEHKKVA